MKQSISILSLLLAFFSGFQTTAHAQLEIVDQLDIKAVQSMQFYPKDNNFRAKVTVVFDNAADRDVKLDKGQFAVSIGNSQTAPVYLGQGDIKELIIPAGENIAYTLDLDVGVNNKDTIDRMMKVFNIVGNPVNKPIMQLKGECGFGAKMKRGWATSNSISVEFEFVPKIQENVLFQ